jgi:hypothetical protein
MTFAVSVTALRSTEPTREACETLYGNTAQPAAGNYMSLFALQGAIFGRKGMITPSGRAAFFVVSSSRKDKKTRRSRVLPLFATS